MKHHADEINKLSRELGLFSNYEINVSDKVDVSPLDITCSSIYLGDNLIYLHELS
ncbi:site-specific DNA-methyltransferase, partial [Escherichia coli]|nr:site-specific DNA-methyltransferase [Escherichia coli]